MISCILVQKFEFLAFIFQDAGSIIHLGIILLSTSCMPLVARFVVEINLPTCLSRSPWHCSAAEAQKQHSPQHHTLLLHQPVVVATSVYSLSHPIIQHRRSELPWLTRLERWAGSVAHGTVVGSGSTVHTTISLSVYKSRGKIIGYHVHDICIVIILPLETREDFCNKFLCFHVRGAMLAERG